MDRNLSYEIMVPREERRDCFSLLYGREEEPLENCFEAEEEMDKRSLRSFYGNLGLLFLGCIAVVILLML